MGSPVCAIATAPGRAAVGIIRLTGDNTLTLLSPFILRDGKTVNLKKKPRYAHFAQFVAQGRILDEILVLPFVAPHSYTGEEAAEIHAHGNPVILQQIVKVLYENGFAPAGPGEFTRRAFENGKLDLSQAEAVKAIIEARNERELQKALNLKAGSFRREILQLRSDLLNLQADITAELDFIDEDLTFVEPIEKLRRLEHMRQTVESLIQAGKRAERYRSGYQVAIIGAPNVGKSSLLNRLCGEERAIVSDIPGTTRDYLESEITLDGYTLTFLDTAGIRSHATDAVEKVGISRSLEKALQADIILLLVDGSLPAEQAYAEAPLSFAQERLAGKNILTLVNKCDQLHPSHETNTAELPGTILQLSVKTDAGFKALVAALVSCAETLAPRSDALLLSVWQMELLERILKELNTAEELLRCHNSPELITASLQQSLEDIAILTGEITAEDVLGRIFSRFCIGK